MNIEIANRLVEYRKKNGLSQEQLADKLGLSRQAVSKWERAEASPDTDNLICLAKLYGVSLDSLLNTDESVDEIIKEQVAGKEGSKESEEKAEKSASSSGETASSSTKEEDKSYDGVHIDSTGLHFSDDEDHGSIGPKGIHVESKDGTSVHIDSSGIHVHDGDNDSDCCNWKDVVYTSKERKRRHRYSVAGAIAGGAVSLITVIGYLLFGFLYPDSRFAWGTGWVFLLLIPLVCGLIEALKTRKITAFPYPVLVAGVYCFIGIGYGYWHPYWILFLTIPLYYIVFEPIDKLIKAHYRTDIDINFGTDKSKDDKGDNEDDDNIIDAD